VHPIIRYIPSPRRNEWINIGVLVFDPETGDRRLRLIESENEYRRVRRLVPHADELKLRRLRDDLESKLEAVGQGHDGAEELQKLRKSCRSSGRAGKTPIQTECTSRSRKALRHRIWTTNSSACTISALLCRA
jgi:hypothetical protein